MAETVGARRPGRPARISREKIVDAVSSAENLDTVTMRELASRLDVRHGALYRWVKNRDELFDLVSDVVVGRVVAAVGEPAPPAAGTGSGADPRPRLARVARAVHDEFLAVPGLATHLSRPHRHHAHSVERLRHAVVAPFVESGVDEVLADQSWQIFISCVVTRLAAEENPPGLGADPPSFAAFVDVLLRGLPVRPSPGGEER